MPDIKKRDEFQPSKDALELWLKTRKRPIDCGVQTLPGYYQTAGYSTDVSWVYLALCVEVAAVVLTLYGGWYRGGDYLIGATIVVFLFLSLDYVGTRFFHKPLGKRCKVRNKLLLASDQKEIERLRKELGEGTLIQAFGVFLIVLSAAFKIMAILFLGSFNTFFYAIMTILYIIVVYIHISHTGYVLSEIATSQKFKKDYENWWKKKDDVIKTKHEPESEFESKVKLNLRNNEISIGLHKIVPQPQSDSDLEDGVYKYKIQTKGVLTDDDIERLIGAVAQSPQQAGAIALGCLRHQLRYKSPEEDGEKEDKEEPD